MNLEKNGSRVYDIDLTDEQFEALERLAALNYDASKISMYFNLQLKDVRAALSDKKSMFYHHYERGILKWQFDCDSKILGDAAGGSVSAYQIYKKEAYYNKLEAAKKRILYKEELDELESIQSLLLHGDAADLSDDEKEHYLQMDMVRRLNDKYESKNMIVNCLRTSYNIGLARARKIYADAINFFYLDDEAIESKAWNNIYADRFDHAAALMLEINDFDMHFKYASKAAEYRGVGKEKKDSISEDLLKRKPVLYSIDPKVLGCEPINRNKLAAWIDKKLPDISMDDKNRLHRDARTDKSDNKLFDGDIDFYSDATLTTDENEV